MYSCNIVTQEYLMKAYNTALGAGTDFSPPAFPTEVDISASVFFTGAAFSDFTSGFIAVPSSLCCFMSTPKGRENIYKAYQYLVGNVLNLMYRHDKCKPQILQHDLLILMHLFYWISPCGIYSMHGTNCFTNDKVIHQILIVHAINVLSLTYWKK